MINELQDILAERKWEKKWADTLNRIEKRLTSHTEGAPLKFTSLQRQVLNHPSFWPDPEQRPEVPNLIVQGATSAGKTLVSELAIIDRLANSKKALVLVPLKAMVNERLEQFSTDLSDNRSLRIFGSSSDYLDHDEELIEGVYDVGIIVYEKLFAMLSQDNCRILQNCGLIVVDELSMLEKDERGPKLELVMQMAKSYDPAPRILCLTTTDCRVSHIKEWLEPCEVLNIPDRPVGLDEYLFRLDGSYQLRRIPGENDPLPHDAPLEDGRLTDFQQTSYAPVWKQKERLLIYLVNDFFSRPGYENGKLLIFVPAQGGTRSIAEYLVESLPSVFPANPLSAELEERLNRCDPDDELNELKKLLPRGVAFHHGSMSTNLREVLEDAYRDPFASLRVIVATETLTIGVNMPIDCMILMDHEVPRSEDQKTPLTRQEYRNFIGRAGRLGLTGRRGISYTLLDDERSLQFYAGSYTHSGEEITSALLRSDEEKRAPFFLSMLANLDSFSARTLEELDEASLSRKCGDKPINAQTVLESLRECQFISANMNARRQEYALSDLGRSLAPYALSLDTSYQIGREFIWPQAEEDMERYGAGMPFGITAQEIHDDKYLLDILFSVCRHSELSASHTLPWVSSSKIPDAAELKSRVYRRLYAILEPEILERNRIKPPERRDDEIVCSLWDNSPIERIFLNPNSYQAPDSRDYQALMRAIIMFYWTKGLTTKDIRTKTQFADYVRFSTGDLERFSDVISYHLDAIYRTLPLRPQRFLPADSIEVGRMVSAFYRLGSRVKYGVAGGSVIIANRHVHGLDRSRILLLEKAAARAGLDTDDYLRKAQAREIEQHISKEQREQLIQKLQLVFSKSKSSNSFKTLLDKLRNELDLSAEARSELERCSAATNADELKDALSAYLLRSPYDGMTSCSSLHFLEQNNNFVLEWIRIYLDAGTPKRTRILLGFLPEKAEGAYDKIRTCFENNDADAKLLLAAKDSSQLLWSARQNGVFSDSGLTCQSLAEFLASSVWLKADGAETLFRALTDLRGFPLSPALSRSYASGIQENTEADFQILCDQSTEWISRLTAELNKQKKTDQQKVDLANYRILPWGKELLDISPSIPTIILRTRDDIVHSDSQSKFLYRVQQNGFKDCLVLQNDSMAVRAWTSEDRVDDGSVEWRTQYANCPVEVAVDIQEQLRRIREFLDGWKRNPCLIGVSYAHFDGTDQKTVQSDVTELREVVRRLNERYGEHRILFDENPSFRSAFHIGPAKTLPLYRECRLGLVLCNDWTRVNQNCKDEIRVMLEQERNGKMQVWPLITSRPGWQPITIDGKLRYSTLIPRNEAEWRCFFDDVEKTLNIGT